MQSGLQAAAADPGMSVYALLQARLARLEKRVDLQEARFETVPSMQQIVAAVDDIFSRTNQVLDERFADQARSIENLKLKVSHTDELLEKVLESIYALQEQPVE